MSTKGQDRGEVYKFKVDLQPGSLTVLLTVAGEQQPYRKHPQL